MSAPSAASILEVRHLVKHFPGPARGQVVHAVNDVSFSIAPGETVAMVGESGSGKSTIGRVALRLDTPTGGRILFDGRDVTSLSTSALRPLRSQMQMVFQDPWGSLNPRVRISALIEEPFLLHTSMSAVERRDAALALAEQVRLNATLLDRYPSQLSGGQLQRVAVARAIALRPKLVVLDEPTSSLDPLVRAEVLELLVLLKTQTRAAFLFITHDLGTVRLIADRVIVLYLGMVVESAPTAALFAAPQHPYTQALLSAHLPSDPLERGSRFVLAGEVPSPLELPAGCVFASRCPIALPRCRAVPVVLDTMAGDRAVACVRSADGSNRLPQLN